MFRTIGLLDSGDHACNRGCKCQIQLFHCLRNFGQAEGNRDINTLAVVTVFVMLMPAFGRTVAMICGLRINVIHALRMDG